MLQTAYSTSDLDRFQSVLETRKAELEGVITRRDAIAIERSADHVDEVQLASERALAISKIDRESKELRQVRAALQRIREGSFGICEECEEPIPLKRLSAIPWASLCRDCQEARDRDGEGGPLEDDFLGEAA